MLEYVSLAENHFGISFVPITAQEYRSTGGCPWCGGDDLDGDRFRLFLGGRSSPRVWCRQCGKLQFLDSLGKQDLDDEELAALRQQMREKMVERQAAEKEKQESALRIMKASLDHLKYYNNQTEETLAYWHKEGMSLDTIHKYRLGYCEHCPMYQSSASYTIPVLYHDQPYNIRHRLVSPNGGGKYRPHMKNLPIMLFNADDLDRKSEFGLLLEGEKKAMVVGQETGIPNVGIMGLASFRPGWVRKFDNWGRVVVALDPDTDSVAKMVNAENRAASIAQMFEGRGLVATFPVKVDDFFVKYGGSGREFSHFLADARPV